LHWDFWRLGNQTLKTNGGDVESQFMKPNQKKNNGKRKGRESFSILGNEHSQDQHIVTSAFRFRIHKNRKHQAQAIVWVPNFCFRIPRNGNK
jgi:hypothetical protein